jgi:hypothetical protein
MEASPIRLSPVSTVVATPRQVSCDLDGDAAILHTGTGIYYTLDRVGARIWELLQAPRLVSEIRDRVVAEYAVEPARCEADVLALLTDLATHDLVRVTDGPG